MMLSLSRSEIGSSTLSSTLNANALLAMMVGALMRWRARRAMMHAQTAKRAKQHHIITLGIKYDPLTLSLVYSIAKGNRRFCDSQRERAKVSKYHGEGLLSGSSGFIASSLQQERSFGNGHSNTALGFAAAACLLRVHGLTLAAPCY